MAMSKVGVEPHVFIPVEDSIDWLALSWEAKAVYLLLARVVDKHGAFSATDPLLRAISDRLDVPTHVVNSAVPELAAVELISVDDQWVRITGFVEGQQRAIALLPRRHWSRAAYAEVMARDLAMCRYCGDNTLLSIDHVVPRCQGGSDDATNLVVACRRCNSRKGGRTPRQAGMVLLPVSPTTECA